MNPLSCSAPRPADLDGALADLLQSVRWHFYAEASAVRRFYRDRRMLLYALTWPAVWLERRGLTCSSERYRSLIAERLAAIRAHGDPLCWSPCFPRYLLKCLQDWFDHHGDDLYGELKHLRNALDQVLASARFAQRVQRDARNLDVLVATHRLLHAQRAARASTNANQLSLF
jgi:hypothetical protein